MPSFFGQTSKKWENWNTFSGVVVDELLVTFLELEQIYPEMAILRNGKNTLKYKTQAEVKAEAKAKAKAKADAKADAKPTIHYPEEKPCVCAGNFRYGDEAWFDEHLRSGKCTAYKMYR